jgi:tRNA threonylcarbamoyladenosine biosynthesis protein TsaB
MGAGTLKGLMLATGKPAAGVSSLAALALNAGKSSKIICSVMDAGRGQVYLARFAYKENGDLAQLCEDKVLNPADMEHDSDEDVIFIGDGAVKYADIITSTNNKKISIASALQQYIRASSVGILGIEKYKRNELLDARTFVPIYLRSADAVMKKSLFQQ